MKRLFTLFLLLILVEGQVSGQGGVLSPPSQTVCSGANNYTLTLSGQISTVHKWEYSWNAGGTWDSIVTNATTMPFNNIVSQSPANVVYYRVYVDNPISAYSSTATVTFNPQSNAGTVAGTATVCINTNSGSLTVSGHTGTVSNWASSTNGGATWTNITNTTTTQNYSNLTDTTMYLVVVKSGTCSADTAYGTITTAPPTVAGTTAGTTTVCSGSNGGDIILSGQTGGVVRWEYSLNGGTYTSIANTNDTLPYTNLVTSSGPSTYVYHAIVQSGTCTQATSSSTTITVTPAPNPGTLSGIATVCATSNSGSVNLSSYNGNIIYWQSSTDGGATWDSIANTSQTENYGTLTVTTTYHAAVKLGSCVAFSNNVTITVDPASIGGSITSNSSTVCSGTNSGTLTLNGETGGVKNWQSASNPAGPWTNIGGTDTFQVFNNLTGTTYFQVIVQSGVCQTATSSIYTVTVDPKSVGGAADSNQTVCIGMNSGSVLLNGHIGNITHWEQSTNAGSTWLSISNSTTTQTYLNLVNDTWYRALVKSGVCPADTSLIAKISVAPLPTADAGADQSISLGYSAQLAGSGGTSYSWSPAAGLSNANAQSPFASPTETTTYTLTVTDANGCTDDDEVQVEVAADFKFIITNLITPNGDGKNDTWYVGNISEYPDCEVTIFSIYNVKLFSASPYNNDWDGTFNGKELPDGTYYYVIKCPDSEQENKGYITLLRNK